MYYQSHATHAIFLIFLCNSILCFLLVLGIFVKNWFCALGVIFYLMVFTSLDLHLVLALFFIPYVMASRQSGSFPSIAFKDFSDFILGNFGPKISLPTVMTILLSMTNNTELLSLHFKQVENAKSTSWIKCLARAIKEQLGDDGTKTLFSEAELSIFETATIKDPDITSLAAKLGQFSQALEIYPYNQKRKFTGTLQSISHDCMKPALLICPNSAVCLTAGCNHSSLHQKSRLRDIPHVTLIKGTNIYHNVQLLSGQCNKCKTIYYADHERTPASEGTQAMKFFLNSAQYLKVGQKLWVNREFSTAVLNAIYDLHASASGWMNFFKDTYANEGLSLSRRHIWAAFVQESIRQISVTSGIDFSIQDTASIEEVTESAFAILGKNGVIYPAEDHSCAECSQPYKARSDLILNPNDHSAVGVGDNSSRQRSESEMDVDVQNVTMKVLDGIVVGTKHCAYDNCTSDLVNYRGGSFCQVHEHEFGNRCRVRDCTSIIIPSTMACANHQGLWNKYKLDHSAGSLAGSKRMLNRRQENLPWNSNIDREHQPHDQPALDPAKTKHFFGPATFYCVETICAPCGVVVAWAKFAKSESESNILAFLNQVYPVKELRPNYICIDKACRVLKHIVAQGLWDEWSETTRFIVDSYHYQNHRKTDALCQTWCNPAPTDGSAPNLVITARDSDGKLYQKRAFNTQVNNQVLILKNYL